MDYYNDSTDWKQVTNESLSEKKCTFDNDLITSFLSNDYFIFNHESLEAFQHLGLAASGSWKFKQRRFTEILG